MSKYHPGVVSIIDSFCQEKGHKVKTFKRKLILFLQDHVSSNNIKNKEYERWMYRFSKREDTPTYDSLAHLYDELSEKGVLRDQFSGGKLTQIIQEDAGLLAELESLHLGDCL